MDALRALAIRMRDAPRRRGPARWSCSATRSTPTRSSRRRAASSPAAATRTVPPYVELCGFEEYTRAYRVSWSDPPIRWLLSTVPSAMIFDDHDVIDDWNTTHAWIEAIRAQGWWDERIVSAFTSYWIYQHIGNLSPESLATDDVYNAVLEAEDGEPILREFAWRADRTVNSHAVELLPRPRLGAADHGRLARRPDPGPGAADDGRRRRVGLHLRARHSPRPRPRPDRDLAAVAHGPGHAPPRGLERGAVRGRVGPARRPAGRGAAPGAGPRALGRVQRLLDLDARHDRRDRARGGNGGAPATIVALSGDVHHAYLAEVSFPGSAGVRSKVYQAVCSPFRNPLDTRERRVMKAMASKPAAAVTRRLARAAGVPDTGIHWQLRQDAVFDNVVATLSLHGREAELCIERARPSDGGHGVRLEPAFRGRL